MAITDFSGLTINAPQVGIQITKVTDSSADWASVANSTYFYDKTAKLVYFKNSTGTIYGLFSGPEFIPLPDNYEVFRGRTFRYDSTTVDTYAGIATLNNASALGQITATTNFYQKFVRLRYYRTTVSTGIMTSVRSTDLQWYVGGGFRFVTTFRVSDTAFGSACQQFYGLAGTTAELTYGGVSQVLVRTNLNIIGVGSDNGDTNLQIFYNDASGNDASKIDLGVNFPANRTAGSEMTTMYNIQLYNEVNTTSVKYEVINLETGAIAQGTLTTDLPATTQGLSIHATRAAGSPITGTGQFELHKWGCSDTIK